MLETQVRRLATVSAGDFSQFHHDAWRRLDVNLVGVCSLDKVQAAATAAAFNGRQAFDDFKPCWTW